MKSIKFLALVISILALLCSCGSNSNMKPVVTIKQAQEHRLKKVKAWWVRKTLYGTGNFEPVDSVIKIIEVDTMYKVGDYLTHGTSTYQITN